MIMIGTIEMILSDTADTMRGGLSEYKIEGLVVWLRGTLISRAGNRREWKG